MKKLMILATIFLMANIAAAKNLKINDINLKAGQIFKIELKTNPTTGYDRYVAPSYSTDVIEKVSEDYKMDVDKEICGAPSIKIYTFKAVGKGYSDLVFEYKRLWEKNENLLKTKLYRVIVQENNKKN